MGRRALRITADTNLLLRTVLQDDGPQSALADAALAEATTVAVPPAVLCEFVWVLRRAYGYATDEIAGAVEAVCDLDVVFTDRGAVDLGLRVLRAGGDFADGVIAQQGRTLGGSTFASFDTEAVRLIRDAGLRADDPGGLVAD